MVRWPRWPPCPYMVKTFKNLLLHNRGCLGAESLHESSGTRGQPKVLKELSYVDVWPFYGKVKFASLCICMSSIHLNGKIVKSFKGLILWSLWANFVQISYGAAGLGGSVGCAVRLETRRSRVQPPPRSATFFRGDWSWNIFYGHSLPSSDSRRAVVSFWRKNVHNTG